MEITGREFKGCVEGGQQTSKQQCPKHLGARNFHLYNNNNNNEMKLLRLLAGYTFYDYKTNDSIRRELQTDCILDKIDEYRRNCLAHIQRMPQNRIPLKSYLYSPQGKRTIGRPKKRCNSGDGTGQMAQPWMFMMIMMIILLTALWPLYRLIL